ncbi:hypothetical protein GF312_14445 [Candidatus Poribacteria bacterium]|nr:hypothetical protein [Candidatus Poribacteria bacterium]
MYLLNRKRLRVAVLLVVICMMLTEAFGWCPIAHYLIAREAATQKGIRDKDHPLEHYANLPDYEPSKELSVVQGVGQKVTDYFCWSHGVIDKGLHRTSLIIVLPKVPEYADDGRYPGPVMKSLITEKLDLRGIAFKGDRHWDLMNTVNGFRVHNAADRVVHFEFFKGAEEDYLMDDYLKKEAWIIHHGLKEVYADYLLLRDYGYKKDNTGTDPLLRPENYLDAGHKLTFSDSTPPGYPSHYSVWVDKEEDIQRTIENHESNPYVSHIKTEHVRLLNTNADAFILWGDTGVKSLGFKGNAALMNLAQKISRKNRRNLHAWGNPEYVNVQTIEEINEILETSDEAKHVLDLFSLHHWATWEHPVVTDLTDIEYEDTNGNTIRMDNPTPMGHKAEYERLLDVYTFLRDRRKYSKDHCPVWTEWKVEEIDLRYKDAIKTAKEWIYVPEELKLKHH